MLAQHVEAVSTELALPIKRVGNDWVVQVNPMKMILAAFVLVAVFSLVLMALNTTHVLNVSRGWQAMCDAGLTASIFVFKNHHKYL